MSDGSEHVIAQPEPAYALSDETQPGVGHRRRPLRLQLAGQARPPASITTWSTAERTMVKQTTVGGGFQPDDYRTERLWADAADGTLVPISVVCRRGQALDGTAPCLLYGYGSYEIPIDPAFSLSRLNLLERGFVFAIAHVRGGGEMGRPWYEQGRLMHKTEHLHRLHRLRRAAHRRRVDLARPPGHTRRQRRRPAHGGRRQHAARPFQRAWWPRSPLSTS